MKYVKQKLSVLVRRSFPFVFVALHRLCLSFKLLGNYIDFFLLLASVLGVPLERQGLRNFAVEVEFVCVARIVEAPSIAWSIYGLWRLSRQVEVEELVRVALWVPVELDTGYVGQIGNDQLFLDGFALDWTAAWASFWVYSRYGVSRSESNVFLSVSCSDRAVFYRWRNAKFVLGCWSLLANLSSQERGSRLSKESGISRIRVSIKYAWTRRLESKWGGRIFTSSPLERTIADIITAGVLPVSPAFLQDIVFNFRNRLAIFRLPTLFTRVIIWQVSSTILVVRICRSERIRAFSWL